jgi:hypothetical protein
MGAPRKIDLNSRLEAYFATLRSSSLKEVLKRSAGNWQVYAAVTGSAMAMVTSASASIIGSGSRATTSDPIASARTTNHLADKNLAFMDALELTAEPNSRHRFLVATAAKTMPASQAQAPAISSGGVVPLDGTENIIQPGEWVSIFGSNLASGTATSNGDFPTSLGGTRVEINGKAAFLLFVSPGQINLQAPDDTATGTVSVVVTTSTGSATSSVTLSQFAPSFILLGAKYVSGIILRSNHSGAYGGGTYDLLGPTGSSLGYPTVAAQAGAEIGRACRTQSAPGGRIRNGTWRTARRSSSRIRRAADGSGQRDRQRPLHHESGIVASCGRAGQQVKTRRRLDESPGPAPGPYPPRIGHEVRPC